MSGCIGLSKVLHEEYNQLYPKEPLPPEIADDLDQVIAALHKKDRSALCISGGGIRSATFALGLIQGLAKLGTTASDSVLAKLHYLSTVSGGGYIGSWLSGWSARHGGIEHVVKKLREPTGDKLSPEPRPLRHLREFSNYLTPKLGLLSADTWTFAGTYFRNLVLMWLVLIPLFIGVLAIPRLFVSLVLWLQPEEALVWLQRISPLLLLWALAFLGITRPVGKAPPKGWIYTNAAFQLLCLLPLCLVGAALVISHAWFDITRLPMWNVALQAAAVAAFSSLIYSFRYWRGNSREKRDDVRPGVSVAFYTFKKQALEIAVAAVSGAFFGALIYWFLGTFEHGKIPTVLEGGTTVTALPMMKAPDALAWLGAYPPDISQSMAAPYVVFGVPMILLALLLQSTLFVGGTSWFNEDFDREWWGRASAWVFIAGITWIVVTGTAIYGPVGLLYAPKTIAAAGGISGLFALLVGKSGKTGAKKKQKEEESTAGKSSNALLVLAVPLFVLVLLAALSLGTTAGVRSWLEHGNKIGKKVDPAELAVLRTASWSYQQKKPASVQPLGDGEQSLKTSDHRAVEAEELAGLDHLYVIEQTSPQRALLVVVGPLLLSLLASWFIGVNRFSMHALYRDRLIRGYLGASNVRRSPNPFTGFDPKDNIRMTELPSRPMHLVNMTLNLVAGEKLAWQERKAESFTASPLHCGNLHLGYRASSYYGGPRGMTLGTAVGISGAAASPNMGYHSSTALAFLLTFFNVRLGWWLGNPGPAGDKTCHLRNPKTSLRPLLAEVFGTTDDEHPYVYLSDGGHFENLGFYEMVLRRCRRIIISDAGSDAKFVFEGLGNAIRKIFIDFGIPVRIDRMGLFPRPLDKSKNENPRYCATGKILYSKVDPGAPDGEFVYIKPVFYGDEPYDIYNYATTNEDFPHQSTGDQFFSESQFESYRALGDFTVSQICSAKKPGEVNTVEELIEAAKAYANPPPKED
ncbi:MAG TPA: hypothetical protein VE078_18680 [Thermoanaerobaculia bacterium]|nr:hypothetical protein [Thermoanaerobaculia bacterium]